MSLSGHTVSNPHRVSLSMMIRERDNCCGKMFFPTNLPRQEAYYTNLPRQEEEALLFVNILQAPR